jgi:hypothetical protein
MFCHERRLIAKGAVDAAGIATLMFKTGKKATDILGIAAKIAHAPKDVIQASLDGDLTPMPPHIKRAILKALDIEDTMDEENEKPMPKENPKEGDKKPMDDEKPKEKADPSAPMMLLLSVEVPKSVFEDAELAASFIEEHGYKPGMMTETDNSFVFQQAEGEDLDLSGASKVELGDGIMGLIVPTKGAKACSEKPKEKAMGTPTIPIAAGSDAVPQDDNPHLALARQTNVLLGSLIQEIQKLSQKFDEMSPGKMEPEENEEEEADEELTKSLDLISKYRDNINQALKRMNI